MVKQPVLEGFMAKWIGNEKCSPALFIDYARKSRMVADALKRDSWVHNLERVWTDDMMEELLTFANLLQHITLAPAVNDQIIWKLTADRGYSARSTYTTSSLRQLLESVISKHMTRRMVWLL